VKKPKDRNRYSDWTKKDFEAHLVKLDAYFAMLEAERAAGVSGDRDSFADRHFLRPAKNWGNWHALADGLERGSSLTPAMRKFVVAVLRGEVKRKKERPLSVEVRRQYLEIAAFVFCLKHRGAKDFISKACEFFGTDPKRVRRAVNDFPQMDEETASSVLNGSPKFRDLPSRGISTHSGKPIIMHYRYPPERHRRTQRQEGQ
jgi:hypothetical protein